MEIPCGVAAARFAAFCPAYCWFCIVAYGAAFVKPTHHWLLDIPAQLHRDGPVLDAFVVERTRVVVKG
eukprot:4329648-Lingulodinium_polyedra.AAC.1